MDSPLASAIAITWRRNRAYAERLVSDLAPDQWLAQPVPGRVLNHPAWVLAHLSVYTPICTALLRAGDFADPIDHPHGQASIPSADPAAYLPPAQLLAEFLSLHDDAAAALAAAPAGVFLRENPLERWRAAHPRVADMLVTLMVKHESAHLGQLSAWRRAIGRARVAM